MKMQDFMQKIKEKKLKRSDWLILVLAGILILIIALPTDTKEKKQAEEAKENISKENNTMEASKDEIERKLEDILEVLKKQPKEHDALEAVNAQLKKTLNELMKINENNKLLTKESLDMIKFELNIAKNAVLTPQTGNYSKNAYDEERIQTVSGFDARQ